jgi:hypothetical protein
LYACAALLLPYGVETLPLRAYVPVYGLYEAYLVADP